MKNRVGLGTFPLGGVFSVVPTNEAQKIVRMFLEEGGYYIDTAPMYSYGYVEQLLGNTLQHLKRESYCLITKCGFIGIENKETIRSSKPDDVINECHKSLKRLKTDHIDIYLVHSPDPNTPFVDTIGAMEKLQKEGKVREIGVSNVSLDDLRQYNHSGKIKYIQNRFSLINQGINQEFSKYLTDHQISLIPYQAIERGQLTSKVFENYKLSESDLRSSKPEWEYERYAVIASWVKTVLFPIARKLHIPLSQLAISWCLHQSFVSWVQVGTSNQEHLILNLDSNDYKISPQTITDIDNSYRQLVNNIKEKYGKEIHEFRGLNNKYY